MARIKTWRTGPGISGAIIDASKGWTFVYNSVILPNSHTILRMVCYGALNLKGSVNVGSVNDNIPPTTWFSSLTLMGRVMHQWCISSRVAIAEIYDSTLVSPARVPYWQVQTDVWDIDIKPNMKIPATGNNQISWQGVAYGGNPSALGGYYVMLGSRILTMSP